MTFSKITLLFLALSSNLFSAEFDGLYDDGGWEFIKDRKGFKVYSRKMPGSNIMGFKVEGHINAPVIDVMATLRDVKYSTEWQPDLVQKEVIEDRGADEALTYSRIDMPWPLDDRDYVLHNKLLFHKEKNLLFIISKSITHPKYAHKKGIVRASIGYSNIGLRPVSENKTYVEWTLFGDPRGNIPNWIVNFYQQSFPIGFFETLENRANTKKIPILPGLRKKAVMLEKIMVKNRLRKVSSEQPVQKISKTKTKR